MLYSAVQLPTRGTFTSKLFLNFYFENFPKPLIIRQFPQICLWFAIFQHFLQQNSTSVCLTHAEMFYILIVLCLYIDKQCSNETAVIKNNKSMKSVPAPLCPPVLFPVPLFVFPLQMCAISLMTLQGARPGTAHHVTSSSFTHHLQDIYPGRAPSHRQFLHNITVVITRSSFLLI